MSEENRERIVNLENRVEELQKQQNKLQDRVAHHNDVIDGSGTFTIDDLYQNIDSLRESIEGTDESDSG